MLTLLSLLVIALVLCWLYWAAEPAEGPMVCQSIRSHPARPAYFVTTDPAYILIDTTVPFEEAVHVFYAVHEALRTHCPDDVPRYLWAIRGAHGSFHPLCLTGDN